MYPFEDFLATVNKAAAVFENHGVRFHLTGGSAGIAHGEPRMTQDVDIVVDNEAIASDYVRFCETLDKSDFDYDAETLGEAVKNRGMFQLLDSVEVLKLDVYPRELIPGELTRTVRLPIADSKPLPFASRQDTILSKLIWVSHGSHKSRKEVRVLFRRADEDQRAFVMQMAKDLKLERLLAEVLAEPEEFH